MQGTDLADGLSGLDGDDTVEGLGGNDTLLGGNGRDVIYGGAGNNTLHGGAEGDQLYGDAFSLFGPRAGGDDLILGGAGMLRGEYGNDTVQGQTVTRSPSCRRAMTG